MPPRAVDRHPPHLVDEPHGVGDVFDEVVRLDPVEHVVVERQFGVERVDPWTRSTPGPPWMDVEVPLYGPLAHPRLRLLTRLG